MPKLSVIVPVYNTEKYLRECIDSILAQTFTDFELILVDDGSTDGSGAICDEYAQMDERIRVNHQHNGGITVARKSGVRMARGEYVTFVDSDDWIDKDMYRIMLMHDPADVIICNLVKATSTGAFEMGCFVDRGHYDKRKLEEHFYPQMLFCYDHCQPGVHPSLCNKLIRTEIIRNVIINVDDTITYGEDALCSYSCMLDASQIYVIDQGLYYYRQNMESVTNVYNHQMFSKLILLGTELDRQFVERSSCLRSQLLGYMARHSLECIRNELLFNSDATYRTKLVRIKSFCDNPMLTQAVRFAIPKIDDSITKLKLLLVKHRLFGILYLLYLGRSVAMKRYKGEN